MDVLFLNLLKPRCQRHPFPLPVPLLPRFTCPSLLLHSIRPSLRSLPACPSLLPNQLSDPNAPWFCHMHPDPAWSSCTIPEQYKVSQDVQFRSCAGFIAEGEDGATVQNIQYFQLLLDKLPKPPLSFLPWAVKWVLDNGGGDQLRQPGKVWAGATCSHLRPALVATDWQRHDRRVKAGVGNARGCGSSGLQGGSRA